nr:hypothetical protein [Tanacetum cinerariifolium]
MQTLAGKLATLNRFLSRPAKKSLPFFETLKDITKKNKHDYRWTKKAEGAFQELKKMALNRPALTKPLPKETLFVYLAASQEAKMALALRHVSKRLRRYFEAYHITVITDQPIKHVLSKADTSGRLASYSVELVAYNITYEPRSAFKGQILADFINEVPVGSDAMVPRQTQYTIDHEKDRKKEWVLYTDGAASAKGFDAGLVLISPTKTEYTYALRLNFESTNNQVEYEAFLAGLRISKIMGDVLSKLASVAFNHLTKEILVETLDVPSMDVEEINVVVEEEGETWMTYHPLFREEYGQKIRMRHANYVIREIHMSTCSMHLKARSVVAKAIRQGYYWPTMHRDAKEKIRPLPEAPGKIRFVIVAVDYFTKWIAAKPLAKTTRKECKKLNITQINMVVAHPQASGLVERENRSLMEGIKTQLRRERKGWVDELPNVLWAHQTSLKTSNEETSYSLTFGSEAVIPTKIGMPTHRTMMIKEGSGNEEEIRLNLDLLTKRRKAAAIREARYKGKVERYNNKRIHPMSFKVGEHVYRKNEASQVENLGKLGPK